jgi:hypothetical protein
VTVHETHQERRARRQRERERGLRRALVYATPRALDSARRLIPGVVVETAVQRLIEAGLVVEPPRGISVPVQLGAGVVAYIDRERRPSGRKFWLVREVISRSSDNQGG